MAVRPFVAWYWLALRWIGVASISSAVGFWMYSASRDLGSHPSEPHEQSALRGRLALLESQSVGLSGAADTYDSRLQLERSAQQQLVKQVRALEEDNARLREELAFFDTLLSGDRRDDRLSVHRFRVEPSGVPGEYRYQLVVSQGTGRAAKHEFRGALQFIVTLRHNDKEAVVTFPGAGATNDPGYRLSFGRVQRVEGHFSLEPSALVRKVQVRVLEAGSSQPRAVEEFRLSV